MKVSLLRRVAPWIVAGATALAFLAALQGQFLNWDDDKNFLENPHYRGLGPANLRWMFTNHYGHYMPLTWLTLGFDYVVWGMNPFGYHLTNLLLHVLNAVLCFRLVDGLLQRARPDETESSRMWAAVAGALFFAIHPLRVESVAWVTERRDLTSGFFFLLTALAYLRMTEEAAESGGRRKWLALSSAAFAGFVLSKAMGMTLPLVFLLLDLWPLRRFGREKASTLFLEKIPFFVLMAVAVILTGWGQREAKAFYSVEDYPLSQSLGQPGYRLSFYVVKTLLPWNLSPLYFYLPQMGWPQVLGWIAIVGATIGTFLARRRAPALAVAWISYLLLISPVSGFAQAGPHFAADRYTYNACLPFAVLFAGALVAMPQGPRRKAIGVVAFLVLLTFALLTPIQCRTWRDSVALWDRAIAVEPGIYFSFSNRGAAKSAVRDWEGAIADFNISIDLNRANAKPWYGRGIARATLGDHAGAVSDLSGALTVDPRHADAYAARGFSRAKLGDRAGALDDITQAARLAPDTLQTVLFRGLARFELGDHSGAFADFTRAIEIDPDSPAVRYNHGMVAVRLGRPAEAVRDLDRALQLRPDYPEALAQRGIARIMTKDPAAGIADLTESLRLKPDASTFLLRASTRALQGDLRGAEGDCSEAIRLKPENADPYGRRGAARLELGDRPGAAQDFQKALDLAPAGWPQRRMTEDLLRRAQTP